jgi:biotin transport system substrate-specific component
MKNKVKFTTFDMMVVGLFAALIAVGAFIKIPLGPVPFSMQFLFCALAGVLLRKELAFLSVAIYVTIGLLGVPVFTKGGGIGYVLQPTFGYLIGFMCAAYVIGFVLEKLGDRKPVHYFMSVVLGLMVLYTIGVSYLFAILNLYMGKAVTLGAAVKIGFLPFLIPDLGWSVLVVIIAMAVRPQLKRAGYVQ